MKRFWWIGLLLFLLAVVWTGAQEKVEPVRPVEPIPEKGKVIDKSQLKPTAKVDPMAESKKTLDKPVLKSMTPVSGLQETSPQYQSLALKEVPPVQGVDGISYQVREFKDFRSGLDLVSAKTKVAPNCAIELENALWNPQGEMYKRPGYSEHSTPPEVLNFLYRYYQMDGDKWTMGGSDTALYFWHEDSSDWTYLIGTEGTEGRWDGTTFEDVFVGTHEGITPVVWNGSTFVEMGASVDSFRARETHIYKNYATPCSTGSTWIKFDDADAGWVTNEWAGYILLFQARIDTAAGPIKDTVTQKAIILSNTENTIIIRHDTYMGIAGTVMPAIPDYTSNWYARIFSWFQVDTVWREGKVDSVKNPCGKSFTTQIFDDSYSWDSTFSYNDYIFEVTSGTGDEKRVFLYDWNYGASSDCGQWNDDAFFVSTFSPTCFDTSTIYRIYKPSFWEGSKFVENFDGSLWLGWTGVGDEQNKNIVVWSETDDLGNWPSGNHIIIESDDGDYITGMAKFPGEYTDVPRSELVVYKNNSFYKIVPSGDGYNFWLITSGVGCVSNSAISPAEGLLLFPDQHGVWGYDKRRPVSISAKIDPIFEEWDTENLEDVSAVYNPQDRHYYMSCPDFVEIDLSGGNFICLMPMDSASGATEGEWTHKIDSSGTEIGDDLYNFYNALPTSEGIAANINGDYVIVYRMLNDLYLRRFNSDDEQVGDSIMLDEGITTGGVSVDMNNAGNIIACWQDTSIAYDDIRCQFVDFDTGKVYSGFYVNNDSSTNVYNYSKPDVAINEDGICVVVWEDYRDYDLALFEIFGQRLQWPDALLGTNFRVNQCWRWDETCECCSTTCPPYGGEFGQCLKSDTSPAIAINEDAFVVVWHRWVSSSGYPIYKRSFLIAGTPTSGDRKVSTGGVSDPATDCDVAMNVAGNYVVTWNETSGLGNYQIYARSYNANDDAQTGVFMVNTGDPGNDNNDVSPAVAINDFDVYTIVWLDRRTVSGCIAYRSFNWAGALMAEDEILIADTSEEGCSYPQIDCFGTEFDTVNLYTLAWNIDHHGWSKETFGASAYCYQHSIFDEVKILFADPEDTFVYNYGTQADDIDDPVILTYQTPYFNFGQYPSFDYEMRFATVEAFLDTGNIYLTWYKNYSDSIYYDSLICGSDCRQEMILPADSLWGWNISMKLKTGSDIDDFTLSRFWWEFTEDQNRK